MRAEGNHEGKQSSLLGSEGVKGETKQNQGGDQHKDANDPPPNAQSLTKTNRRDPVSSHKC